VERALGHPLVALTPWTPRPAHHTSSGERDARPASGGVPRSSNDPGRREDRRPDHRSPRERPTPPGRRGSWRPPGRSGSPPPTERSDSSPPIGASGLDHRAVKHAADGTPRSEVRRPGAGRRMNAGSGPGGRDGAAVTSGTRASAKDRRDESEAAPGADQAETR
jgi:hypothetical protein